MATYTAAAVHEMLEVAATAALEKAGLSHLADAIDWDTAADLECEYRGWGYTHDDDGHRIYFDGEPPATSKHDPDYLYDLDYERWAS